MKNLIRIFLLLIIVGGAVSIHTSCSDENDCSLAGRPQVTLLCSYSDTIPNVEKKILTHYTLYNKILLISSPWNVVI